MTRFEKIVSSLPSDLVLPPELRVVCNALDQNGYPLSGCMRINADYQAALLPWFDKDAEMAGKFAAFGSGPDGSILAFWLLNGKDATNAPVVHLGSEETHYFVLARDFREFLSLLAIGYDELGFDDLSIPPAEPESAMWLRNMVVCDLGLQTPATGAALVSEARAAMPSLEQAIETWLLQRRKRDRT